MTEKDAVDVAKLLKSVGSVAASVPKRVAGVPGALGGFALNTARRGANVLGDVGEVVFRNGVQPQFSPGVNRAFNNAAQAAHGLGTKTIGAVQRGAARMTGVSHASNFNPLNVATGAGLLGGGYAALSRGGANTGAPSIAAAAPGASGLPVSQRAMAMWNGLPTEARYAIGAGVPLALLGGYMGRNGSAGGLGLGALGLGAAAMGGASGGLFGDDARRFSGKMLYNVGSFFGGKNDPASQLDMLGKLSPGLGATVLMGRDPNLSAQDAEQQYNFLTQNKDMLGRLIPTFSGKSASALAKAARCWKGYEPVPGKAPYSEDSCRPVGSKKKKKEKKAGSTVFKLTKQNPEAVIEQGAPSVTAEHHKVTRPAPAKTEDLRPEEVQPS